MEALLRPGMVFVDVGANWGYHTLLAAALVKAGGRVLSLEPDPRLFACLTANLSRNSLTHVVPVPFAASDSAGELLLAGYQESGGNYGVSTLVHALTTANTYWVEARPLDVVLDQLEVGRVDLIKMDIEGAEWLALRGLQSHLTHRQVNFLLLELHPNQLVQQGSSVSDVVGSLQQHGYRGYWVDHSISGARQAAYASSRPSKTMLRPLDSTDGLDLWPHSLWVAPGLKLPPDIACGPA